MGYKLLKADARKAEKIVNCPKISINSFVNVEERQVTEKIFNEFNTLSVVYKKPAELFINVDEPKTDDEEEEEEEEENEDVEAEEEEYEEEEQEEVVEQDDMLSMDVQKEEQQQQM